MVVYVSVTAQTSLFRITSSTIIEAEGELVFMLSRISGIH